MDNITSWIGLIAAAFTSLSYIPQVRKALPRGSTGDLSFKMLAVLTSGLAMWGVYGVLKTDWVIVVANSVGAGLSGAVLLCKVRDLRCSGKETAE